LDSAPCSAQLKEDRGRIVYLTVEQIDRLIAAAKQDENPHVLAFVVIELETAMQRSEILSIRREHVDLHRLTIFVPKAKAGRGFLFSTYRTKFPTRLHRNYTEDLN